MYVSEDFNSVNGSTLLEITEFPILCSPRGLVVRSPDWYSGLWLESKLIPEFHMDPTYQLGINQDYILSYAVNAGNSSWKQD